MVETNSFKRTATRSLYRDGSTMAVTAALKGITMINTALCFAIGAISPLAGVAWLIFAH